MIAFRSWKNITKDKTCECPKGCVGVFQEERRIKVMAHSHETARCSLEPETGMSGSGCVE